MLVGAVLVGGVSAAQAGGDLRGSVNEYAPVSSPSWYVRSDFSYAWQRSGAVTVEHPVLQSSEIGNTWGLGAGIGRYFGRGFRGDVTFEWRDTTDFSAVSTNCCNTTTKFGMRSEVVLANLYYDFRAGERLSPYIGAGIGAARVETFGGDYPFNTCGCVSYEGKTQWNFAWALMAGASLRLDGGVHRGGGMKDGGYFEPGRTYLDVGYRYLNLGDVANGPNYWDHKAGPQAENVSAHEFRIGLRYDLR
jgi:opacity protein-like surface antigen